MHDHSGFRGGAPRVTQPIPPGGRKAAVFWPSLIIVLLSDVVTKYLAHTLIAPYRPPREIVGDALRLTLVYNPGAAFGLHVGPWSRWIFLILTVIALVVLGRLYRETTPGDRLRALALGLVCGGALGNLINRIWSRAGVVDFIDMGVGDARWPTFNAADIGVSVGAFLLAWVLWREDQRAAGKTVIDTEPSQTS